MCSEWIVACSTIAGAIVGSAITAFFSRKKKKRIVFSLLNEPIYTNYSQPKNGETTLIEVNVFFKLLAYNGSDIIRIVNKISFEAHNKRKLIYKTVLKDDEKRITFVSGSSIPSEFSIENIPPYTCALYNCEFKINIEKLKEFCPVKTNFVYTNENGRIVKFNLRLIDEKIKKLIIRK